MEVTLANLIKRSVCLMEIEPEHLAFHNISMKYVVEPGEYEIMVGNSSRDEDLSKIVLTVG